MTSYNKTLFKRNTLLKVYTGNKVLEVPELDVSFKISAHRRRTPNKGEFVVYNLRESYRNLIGKESKYVEFFTSYGSEPLGRIFKGFVDRTDSALKDETPDWTTAIHAIDAGENKEYTTSLISKTFEEGTPVISIFKAFADTLNLPVLSDFSESDVLLTSETYVGPVRNALDVLCRDYGYQWSINFGNLEIIQKGKPPIKDSLALLLSRDNLIGIPEITKKGIKVKTLILPNLIPNRIIRFQEDVVGLYSQTTKKISTGNSHILGSFIIDSIDYAGDRDGQDFYALTEANSTQ